MKHDGVAMEEIVRLVEKGTQLSKVLYKPSPITKELEEGEGAEDVSMYVPLFSFSRGFK